MTCGTGGVSTTLLPDHNYSDAKNRKDHRHHAIDALVAALTDRKLLHRMSSAYDEERQKIEVAAALANSARRSGSKAESDDGLAQARSWRATAPGRARKTPPVNCTKTRLTAWSSIPDKEGGANLVYRKSFRDLNDKEIAPHPRCPLARDWWQAHVEEREGGRKGFESRVAVLQPERRDIPGLPHGIRHVRLTKTEKPEYLVAMRDKSGECLQSLQRGGERLRRYLRVRRTANGRAKRCRYSSANQKDLQATLAERKSQCRFIMRVFKGDLITLDHKGTANDYGGASARCSSRSL